MQYQVRTRTVNFPVHKVNILMKELMFYYCVLELYSEEMIHLSPETLCNVGLTQVQYHGHV